MSSKRPRHAYDEQGIPDAYDLQHCEQHWLYRHFNLQFFQGGKYENGVFSCKEGCTDPGTDTLRTMGGKTSEKGSLIPHLKQYHPAKMDLVKEARKDQKSRFVKSRAEIRKRGALGGLEAEAPAGSIELLADINNEVIRQTAPTASDYYNGTGHSASNREVDSIWDTSFDRRLQQVRFFATALRKALQERDKLIEGASDFDSDLISDGIEDDEHSVYERNAIDIQAAQSKVDYTRLASFFCVEKLRQSLGEDLGLYEGGIDVGIFASSWQQGPFAITTTQQSPEVFFDKMESDLRAVGKHSSRGDTYPSTSRREQVSAAYRYRPVPAAGPETAKASEGQVSHASELRRWLEADRALRANTSPSASAPAPPSQAATVNGESPREPTEESLLSDIEIPPSLYNLNI